MKPRQTEIALLLLLVAALGMAQQMCLSPGFPPMEQFQLEDVEYIRPKTDRSVGYLVIVPEMRFNCHGHITGWNALTRLNSTEATIMNLIHDITFQLWRPSARGSGTYDFIGSRTLDFGARPLQDGLKTVNGVQFFNFTSDEEQLYFQPGDVIGWYIHSTVQSTEVPLTTVYRQSSSSNGPGLRPVDMYSAVIKDTNQADTQPPCEVSLCNDQFTIISSVIPYVTVDYVVMDSTSHVERALTCANTTNYTSAGACDVTLSTSLHTTTQPPMQSPTLITTISLDSPLSLPVIVGAATGVLLIILSTIFIVIVCLCARRRTCVFVTPLKRHRASFHDNPTYSSPDDFIRVETPPTPASVIFNPVQHYPASNGALYALPEISTPIHAATSRTQLDPGHIFDGECYASTYQTNGQCHVYQELTETKPEKRGSLFSQSSLHITKQDLPDLPVGHRPLVPRFSISTGTLPARFPYTLPNTPAPSHPYLEAVDSKPLHLPPTPDDTPPQSAGAVPHVNGAPVSRRLFHSIDDEGYHVPNHEERMQFTGSGSTEELYSRLNRPHAKSRDSREVNFFEQSDVYWEPSSSTAELYNQLALRKYREIKRDQIHVITALGSGQFGAISRGYWEVHGGKMDVAIKFLQPGSSEEDKTLFLQEAATMGQFLHPNIVKLHGVVTVGEPLMIVLELMPKGDLKTYLRDLNNRVPNLPLDLPELFLNFSRQIGYGMNYLSNKAYIHRDLAARNILLTEDFICKIGDFGMTRALSNDETYQSHGGKIPLKWTAPEALNYRQFTAGSDVWSYGIVLFEIWSLGQQPFRRVSDPNKLMTLVNSGHCQAPPPGCPRAIYQLMVKCWHPDHNSRPLFSDICDYLSSPDEMLLYWSHGDRIVSPSVTHLGAPLSEARNLYPDLQFCYDSDTVV